MRAHTVVVRSPSGERDAGVRQRREKRLVEALVAEPADEALGEGVSRVGLPGAM